LLNNKKAEKINIKELDDKIEKVKDMFLKSKFADKEENKEDHDRLSANMKNLYELLINHNHN